MQKMKKTKNALKITAILMGLFFLFSCNPIADESQSDSLLVVVSITGIDLQDNEVNFLQSDVLTIDSDGNEYVTGDTAKVTFTAKLMNPVAAEASHYNSIQVNRYTVQYIRSDGKSVEGVDVPYSFEGSMSALVEIDGTAEVSFIVVREVAKLETPLIDLVEARGEGVLQVVAKIDFYGQDMANNKVRATGYLTIFFANYITADEGEGE
jgi:hypothetical protein